MKVIDMEEERRNRDPGEYQYLCGACHGDEFRLFLDGTVWCVSCDHPVRSLRCFVTENFPPAP